MYWFDVFFQNVVELKGLLVGQVNIVVNGVFSGKFIDCFLLGGGDYFVWQMVVEQYCMMWFQFLGGVFCVDIVIVLLVYVVEMDQQEVIVFKIVGQIVV